MRTALARRHGRRALDAAFVDVEALQRQLLLPRHAGCGRRARTGVAAPAGTVLQRARRRAERRRRRIGPCRVRRRRGRDRQ